MIITQKRIYPVAMMALMSFLFLVMILLLLLTMYPRAFGVEEDSPEIWWQIIFGFFVLLLAYMWLHSGICFIERQDGAVLMRGPGRKNREVYARPAYATMVWAGGDPNSTEVKVEIAASSVAVIGDPLETTVDTMRNIIPYRALAIVAPEGYEPDDLGTPFSPQRRYYEPRLTDYSGDFAVSELNWYLMLGWTPWGKRKMQRVADTVNAWLGHDPAAISEFEAARMAAENA